MTITQQLRERYRDGLPAVPWRLLSLPIERGYPVPWFVAQVDGKYDFRIIEPGKVETAVTQRLCWICGKPLGSYLAFAIGPMCAINRTSGEPPAHRDCADWSARACPALTQQQHKRRDGNIPEEATMSEYGLRRLPGVTLVWITRSYRPLATPDGGVVFKIGDPTATVWYREGRPATRAEVLESIDAGYPSLLAMAEEDGPDAVQMLAAWRSRAMVLVPNE